MRKTDIKVGQSYRASRDWPLYGSKVRVLDKDVPMPYGRKQPGLRVQVERAVGRPGSYFRAEQDQLYTVQSRKLAAPWTDQDDRDADEREREAERLEALSKRIARLDGAYMHRGGLYIDSAHAEAALDKLGVPR